MLAVFLGLSSNNASAGKKICDPQEPDLCQQIIEDGEVAQMSGVVLSNLMAARIQSEIELLEQRLILSKEFQVKTTSVALSLYQRDVHRLSAEVLSLQTSLQDKQDDFETGVLLGVVGSVVFTVLAVVLFVSVAD